MDGLSSVMQIQVGVECNVIPVLSPTTLFIHVVCPELMLCQSTSCFHQTITFQGATSKNKCFHSCYICYLLFLKCFSAKDKSQQVPLLQFHPVFLSASHTFQLESEKCVPQTLSFIFVSLVQWFLHTYCYIRFSTGPIQHGLCLPWGWPSLCVEKHSLTQVFCMIFFVNIFKGCLFCLYVLCALSSPFLSCQPTSLYF